MNDHGAEEHRIKLVYARRDTSSKPLLYAWHREEVLFNSYRIRAVAAGLLVANGFSDLSAVQALDVGCGTGAWLRQLMEWGASPENLYGIDLLSDRIERASAISPGIDFRVASGYSIPLPDCSMDLVSAFTVFSSILAPSARCSLAAEALRVLKPGGVVLVYDYRVSDLRNPDTVGMRKKEMRRIFPGINLACRSLTLAPPFSRRIANLSVLLAYGLEVFLPFLRTHAFYLIAPRV